MMILVYYMRYRILCIPLVYGFFIISLFVFVGEEGIGYRYLCIRIIRVVYIIRIMYLILFVGGDWYLMVPLASVY